MLKPAEMSLVDFMGKVRLIGFEAVETWGRDEHLQSFLDTAAEQGLAVAGFIGHRSLNEGLNDVSQHQRIEAELRASIDIAAKHHVPGLVCFAGRRLAKQNDYEALVACASCLKRVSGYAQDNGISLNVELLNSRVDHSGYVCDRLDWGIALCEMVGNPSVKLLYDIYHMQIMEGDIIRSLHKALPYLGHVHTAGNPDRQDLDDQQELNYPAIFKSLKQSGYQGYVGHEFKPKADAVAAMTQAYNLVINA